MLALPLAGQADVRLPLHALQTNSLFRLDEPLVMRLLATGTRPAEVEKTRSRLFRARALNWTYELRWWSIAAAISAYASEKAPVSEANMALLSSVPAGTYDLGPPTARPRILRLPRIHF